MPSLPELPGVRHADHTLATGVTLHVAEAGDPDAPAILAVHAGTVEDPPLEEVIAKVFAESAEKLPE